MDSNTAEFKELRKRLNDFAFLMFESEVYGRMDKDSQSDFDLTFSELGKMIRGEATHNCNARFREKKSNVALSKSSM